MNTNEITLKRPITIQVECSTNFYGEQRPEKIFLLSQAIPIIEILDRWLSPEKRYFKVMGPERDLYILKFDLFAQEWELTLFAKEAYLNSVAFHNRIYPEAEDRTLLVN